MNEKIRGRQLDISIYTSKYGIPLLERKWAVLLFFVLGLLVAMSLLSPIVEPQFISQATLLVEEPRSEISRARQETLGTGRVSGLYVTTEEEKIKSPYFAAEVLKILPEKAKDDLRGHVGIWSRLKMGVLKLFGIKEKAASQTVTERNLLEELQKRIEVSSNTPSALIWIRAMSMNKDVALVLARSYVDVALASNLEDNKKVVRSEREFLEQQRNQAYQKYRDSEQAVFDFKKEYQIPGDFDEARDIGIQLQLKRLQAQVVMDKERYEMMEQACFTSQVKEAGIVGNIRVISPPVFPVTPSRRAEVRLMFIIIMGGLMLGIGFALLPELTHRGAIRHEIDIADICELPVLGDLPRIKS